MKLELREFIQKFPDVTLADMYDSREMLKDDLNQLYTGLQKISDNYNFDDLKPDQITPLLNDMKEIVKIVKK